MMAGPAVLVSLDHGSTKIHQYLLVAIVPKSLMGGYCTCL